MGSLSLYIYHTPWVGNRDVHTLFPVVVSVGQGTSQAVTGRWLLLLLLEMAALQAVVCTGRVGLALTAAAAVDLSSVEASYTLHHHHSLEQFRGPYLYQKLIICEKNSVLWG